MSVRLIYIADEDDRRSVHAVTLNLAGIGDPLERHSGRCRVLGGFLWDSVEKCAQRTLWLLQHPSRSTAVAARGLKTVRERFLLTRLIAWALISAYRDCVRLGVGSVAEAELRDW